MKKIVTYITLFICLLLIGTKPLIAQTDGEKKQPATAQYKVPLVEPAKSDTVQYLKADPRGIKQETIDKYKKDGAYNYDYTPPEDTESWWDRLLRWIFGHQVAYETTQTTFDTIIYIIIGFAVVMIIYLLVSGNFTGIIRGSAKKTGVEYSVVDIDINAIDFDALIAEAIAEKDYRKVIRLYYLQTLKVLSDKNLIEFQADKTNGDYVRELKTDDLKPVFKRLTYVYEYVWYGHFEIDENNFLAARKAFNDFKTTVKR